MNGAESHLPCPPDRVVHLLDDVCPCGSGQSWPCVETVAAWLALGLDPDVQVDTVCRAIEAAAHAGCPAHCGYDGCTAAVTLPAVDWRARRHPVQAGELTEAMLAPSRAVADASKLAQTVWPSRFHGCDFYGVDCLLDSAAAVLDTRPDCAAPGATGGLLTVLPTGYHTPAWRGELA